MLTFSDLHCSLLKLLSVSSTCQVYKGLTICWLGSLASHHLSVSFCQTRTKIIVKDMEQWAMASASDCYDTSISKYSKIFIIELCIPANLPTVASTLMGKIILVGIGGVLLERENI